MDAVSFEEGYIEDLPCEDGVFDVVEGRANAQYEFSSDQAANASEKYGVKSISLGGQRIV